MDKLVQDPDSSVLFTFSAFPFRGMILLQLTSRHLLARRNLTMRPEFLSIPSATACTPSG
jgi:hypothetical protein